MKCHKCQVEVFLPFKCPYCQEYFCAEHRLPENHECPQIDQARASKENSQTFTFTKTAPYEYTVTYIPVEKMRKVYFSVKEVKHLAVASMLVACVGLSWGWISNISNYLMLTILAITLTISFLTHEIAHKITAQKEGLWAEFRLTLIGLILTLLSIIPIPFKIISPGAVMVVGVSDIKSLGKVSIAGPLTNIILSLILLVTAFLIPPQYNWIFVLAFFNAWIALLNLIPFGIFDGFKVFHWSKINWALVFTISLVLLAISIRYF